MKKTLILLCLLAVLVAVLVSCGGGETTTPDADVTTDAPAVGGDVVFLDAGESLYQVIYPTGANTNQTTGAVFKEALTALRKAIKACGSTATVFPIKDDLAEETPYEILLGDTNREESKGIEDTLAFNEAVIRVSGNKVLIIGKNDSLTAQALYYFIDKYMAEGTTKVVIPADIDEKIMLDLTYCNSTELSYEKMAENVLASFNKKYWNGRFLNESNWFWDRAEMLEMYIDAYEATKDPELKKIVTTYANQFLSLHGQSWTWNEYNDDIMWACIAFSRITLLTGEKRYANIAKTNFDQTYASQVDNQLGGGMWWKKDKTTKNSCANCPAAIAACLLAQTTGDNSYYDKAASLIDWEVKNMFEVANGKIYDSYNKQGEKGTWSSTYNQGTFIGACTYLWKYTKDDTYLKYANKAADFAIRKLTSGGILDNGEASTSNGDLPGFKGILVRWLYRLAKETENIEYLVFLQTNAATAYKNQNSEGLIWTNWRGTTPEPDVLTKENGYPVFGMSTAVALMFNCQQWWE